MGLGGPAPATAAVAMEAEAAVAEAATGAASSSRRAAAASQRERAASTRGTQSLSHGRGRNSVSRAVFGFPTKQQKAPPPPETGAPRWRTNQAAPGCAGAR